MTKKDYIRAAKIVSGIGTHGPHTPITALCAWQTREAFVVFFAGDNPKFDENKFRDACGETAKQYRPPQD